MDTNQLLLNTLQDRVKEIRELLNGDNSALMTKALQSELLSTELELKRELRRRLKDEQIIFDE